jgi:hypothetical protein
MKAQIAAEYTILFVLFITIFSFVAMPTLESSREHMSDVSTLTEARLLLDSLKTASQQAYLSGRRTLTLYSPCSPLNCSSNRVDCLVTYLRDPLNPDISGTTWPYFTDLFPVSVNGIDCSGTGGIISSEEGYIGLVIE